LSALKRFTQWDFIARVDAAGIAWHEKTLGQLFCDGSATGIIAMLRRDMERAGVTLWLGCTPCAVRREGAGFVVETSRGLVRATSVVVATGGKSIPKMGASAFGYRLAEEFGLHVTETRPGLVPLTFAEQELERFKPLAGVAVEGRVAAGRGWIGITPRNAFITQDVSIAPLLPAWAWLLIASMLTLAAWLREGRR
jgi:predicted flavoprotein YhiN